MADPDDASTAVLTEEGLSPDDLPDETLADEHEDHDHDGSCDHSHARPETPEFRVPYPPAVGPARPPATLAPSPSPTSAPLQTPVASELANSDVMVRYRTAADIANEVMRRVVEAVQPGRRVYELCAYGDGLILESTSRVFKKSGVEKGIAKPTSIAVNNCLSNYSALEDDLQVLHHGDLVKIELAVHIDGYVAAAAHTTVINPKPDQPVLGRAADVVCAAYFGLEVALRILKAGNKVSEVTTALSKVAQAFKCHTTIEPGHKAIAQARRNVLEVRETRKRTGAAAGTPGSPSRAPTPVAGTNGTVPPANAAQQVVKATGNGAPGGQGGQGGSNAPLATGATAEQKPAAATQTRAKDEDHVFEAGQVWTVNVLMSSGDGKVKEKAEVKPTVYQRNVNKTFNLKLKVSRTVYNEISKRFSVFPFSIRALEDKRGRLGILECVQHNLLEPYPVYFDQSAAYVAQFKCTVLVPPNSTMPLRITSCPPLPYVHSEFSILNDRDMGAILRTPIKTVSNGQVVLISAVPGGSSKDTKGKAKSAPPADGAVEDGV